MRITPVTVENRQTQQQNPAFGALKFKLDQKSKLLLCQTCINSKYNVADTNKFIINVENSLKKMNNVAKVVTQQLIDNNPKTRGLSVNDIWAKDTFVNLSIRTEKTPNEGTQLVAKFDGENFIKENDVDIMYNNTSAKPSFNNLEKEPNESLAFLRSISDARLKFTRFVNSKLKEQPDYKMMNNDYTTNPTVDLGSKSINEVIRSWVYDI